ncbi:MAG: FAD-dependent oxidoreductase [Clostridia bacterium]|nr:FAD-dependent oxidoreductase [Clostridia bacterium]
MIWTCDVMVIGGGPAGLAAAIAADKEGARVVLVEREARLGGILKQCIHDGFGLVRFEEKLSGPEYAERFIDEFRSRGIEAKLLTFVTSVERIKEGFKITLVSRDGVEVYEANSIVLATGCRERTSKQIMIHGTRPSGVFTAGTDQYYTNMLGQLPTKRCVILGSGDIGLIMARRLTLEGAEVLGVYEIKNTPSGLTRNIHQCLHDYNIPLYLSHTVTRVYGKDRLEAVEVMKVDDNMKIIPGTEERIECDALILSVGLIPENELAETLEVRIDNRTKGPICDSTLMTNIPGIFACGNALHVNDLVDYVSESGEIAGKNAAHFKRAEDKSIILITPSDTLQYIVPQTLNLNRPIGDFVIYFRSARIYNNCVFRLKVDGRTIFEKRYPILRPPEMERVEVSFKGIPLRASTVIRAEIVRDE